MAGMMGLYSGYLNLNREQLENDVVVEDESMDLHMLKQKFSVCKVTELDPELLKKEFVFVGNTDQELSLICESSLVPDTYLALDEGWDCFRIAEDASFSKYGMIAFLADIIASLKTSILVVGTYDTDYILVKQEKMPAVVEALKENHCRFI